MKNYLLAGFEFFGLILIYWSIGTLKYGSSDNLTSIVLSIIVISLYGVYTIIRAYFDPIGSLYMLKKIIISTVFTFSFDTPSLIAVLILT